MSLAEVILRDIEPILAEWDDFAATRKPAAEQMDSLALRDHAKEILQAIARDLQGVHRSHEPDRKANGRASLQMTATAAAAQTHSVSRAQCGFDVVQMASEYAALRARILRRWAAASVQDGVDFETALEDAGRFNEAIDQALMESLRLFTQEVEKTRGLFLAVVGHDLRNPLMTILSSAQSLAKQQLPDNLSALVERISRGGRRMQQLVDDLSDYNHVALNKFIPVTFGEVNLAELCALEIADLQTTHAGRTMVFSAEGDLHGFWDRDRLQQLLSNLLKNALDYGAPEKDIEVKASVVGVDVVLSVMNHGTSIPSALLARIFEPLVRGGSAEHPTHTNLGLGLFIAREITKAHRGSLEVSSDDRATVFTVCIPRDARPPSALPR